MPVLMPVSEKYNDMGTGRTPRSLPSYERLKYLRSIMSFQNNLHPFSSQNGASVRPAGGALPISVSSGTHAALLSYNPPGHPSNDVQVLPMFVPQQTFQTNQPWMPGQPMGAGSMLLMQERALNPDIGVIPLHPPSLTGLIAIHDIYHPAGVSLAMNTVGHR